MCLADKLTENQQAQVRYGQAEEVVIGHGLHGGVLGDYETSADVTDYSTNEDCHIRQCQWNHHLQRKIFWPEHLLQVLAFRQVVHFHLYKRL